MEKEIRADAKLKNLPGEMLETLWRLRNPEDDGQKLTFVEVLAWLNLEHGIDSSLGALSEFYSWLRLKRRIESAAARAVLLVAVDEMWVMAFISGSQVGKVGSHSATAAGHGRIVGGGDVDFLEILVVEGAADLLDDRGAAAGLEVGRH